MSKHIGFIGLGNMGRGMCRNLIRAGHTLTVFDTSEAAAEAFRGQAEIAGSVAQVGQNSDVLFLSLPNSNIVESVVAQLLETGLEGKILLDTSTSYPLSTQKLAQQVKEAGGFMQNPGICWRLWEEKRRFTSRWAICWMPLPTPSGTWAPAETGT